MTFLRAALSLAAQVALLLLTVMSVGWLAGLVVIAFRMVAG